MELTGINVLKVRALPGEFEYADGTKMKELKLKYRRYTTDGKVFISNDDTFYQEVLNGGLHTITLGTNELDQLSLNDYITWKQVIGQKMNTVKYDSITVENYKPQTVQQFEELS
jgi:hypothetical protein